MKNSKLRDIARFFLMVAIVVVINVIGSLKFFRLDLTSENRYSLSDATKELLQSFDEIVYVKIYLEGDFPSGFQRLQRETRQMLDEFRAYNAGIQYEFMDPAGAGDAKVNKDVQEQLQYKGLKYYELQVNEADGQRVQKVFPGAIMSLGDEERPVQLLMDQLGVSPEAQINASVQNLEYALANGIRGLVQKEKPLIGFLDGHGELEPPFIADFARSLSENYRIDRFHLKKFKTDSTETEVSITSQQRRLNRFNAIIVAKPEKPFNDLDKFLLDQYVMTGGKILWLIDAIQADMDSLSEGPQFISFPIYDRLNLSDLLFKYGARINTNIVMDVVAAGVSDRRKTYPWVYFPMVLPQVKHPITKNLNAIKLQFPSSVDTIISPGVKKTVLLRSSQYSNVMATPHIVKLDKLYSAPRQELFQDKNVPMAVLLEGEFESAFKNRLVPKESGGEEVNFIEKSKSTQMLVVADGDIIKNQRNVVNPNIPKGTPLPLGFDQFTGSQYGNKDFLLNAVDYMLDGSGLIDIRSRELRIRLLDINRLKENKLTWQLVNILLPVVAILIFGLAYTFFRRRKYAKK